MTDIEDSRMCSKTAVRCACNDRISSRFSSKDSMFDDCFFASTFILSIAYFQYCRSKFSPRKLNFINKLSRHIIFCFTRKYATSDSGLILEASHFEWEAYFAVISKGLNAYNLKSAFKLCDQLILKKSLGCDRCWWLLCDASITTFVDEMKNRHVLDAEIIFVWNTLLLRLFFSPILNSRYFVSLWRLRFSPNTLPVSVSVVENCSTIISFVILQI